MFDILFLIYNFLLFLIRISRKFIASNCSVYLSSSTFFSLIDILHYIYGLIPANPTNKTVIIITFTV